MTHTYTHEELEAMADRLRGDFGSEYVKDAASMLEKIAAQQRDVDERAQSSTNAIAQTVRVPEGWKLVPKHATQNMLNAFGIKEICWAESDGKTGRRPATARDIWEAMLSAAPKREGE